jgi:hypothetical protein
MKILVNAPTGKQELIEVGEGGGYFDASRVLWDERTDGTLPAITLGGMVRLGGDMQADPESGIVHREGGELVFSQMRMDEHTDACAPTVQQYTDAVQAHLDTSARTRNYDDIVSACSYAGAPNPFQAEGAAFVTWRGDVWAACYQIMGEVQGGQHGAPTIADLIAELPVLVLP